MKKISFNVGTLLCDECALALRRFIGHMEGVESIALENGTIVIIFDATKIAEEELTRITRDSIERLGYKILSKGGGLSA